MGIWRLIRRAAEMPWLPAKKGDKPGDATDEDDEKKKAAAAVKADDAPAGPSTGFKKLNPMKTPKFGDPDGGDLHVPGMVKVKKAPPAEAAETDYAEVSFEHVRDLLNAALSTRWSAGPYGPGIWIVATYPDHVIYQAPDSGAYYQSDYTIDVDGDAVMLGATIEVQIAYLPVDEADEMIMAAADDGVSGEDNGAGAGVAATYREVTVGEAVHQRAQRLFLELAQAFADPPAWIPMLPKPGTYTHPHWGEIVLTAERIKRFVDNFNAGVYQMEGDRPMVPIDAEHETKLSGAVAWMTKMRITSEGGADGKVDWTDRGRTLIEDDRFKFVSPEWYPQWEDPATNEVFNDVLIGAAITTRPFFKDNAGGTALRPLAATEHKEGDPMPEQPQGMTEDQAKSFKAMEERITAVEAERDAAKKLVETTQATSIALAERVTAVEGERRRDRFTAEVLGKSPENGARWFGEPDKHVTMLEGIAEKFGEDSDTFKFYVETNRATAEQLKTSGILKEVGRAGVGGASGDATAKFTALVTARMSEKSISNVDAMGQIAAENPALYHDHAVASQQKVG